MLIVLQQKCRWFAAIVRLGRVLCYLMGMIFSELLDIVHNRSRRELTIERGEQVGVILEIFPHTRKIDYRLDPQAFQ